MLYKILMTLLRNDLWMMYLSVASNFEGKNLFNVRYLVRQQTKKFKKVRSGQRYKTVNHSLSFVSEDNPKSHTNSIENQWHSLKRCVLLRSRTVRDLHN